LNRRCEKNENLIKGQLKIKRGKEGDRKRKRFIQRRGKKILKGHYKGKVL
jgi:hypothetical protein